MRTSGNIVIAAAAAIVLSACTPNYEEPSDLPPGIDSSPSIAQGPASPAPNEEQAADDECAADDFKVEGASGAKPKVTVPKDCAAPTKLLSHDLDEGTGPAVKEGDTASVNYVLVGFSDGRELDASWTSDSQSTPFPVENIGEAGVIAGWNEGLIGVKEGGRRLLVVPPDKGYGGQPGHQLENETLVFVIGVTQVG